ncbi:MAG: leucine-rich repeat protein [Clostridia bacterium]|nr:leucine-rich repeat protein [Clostridia bacterium]
MTFAEKILYLRKKKGIQQNQLAKELNVSRQSIYKWESGACMPELDKIKKMAEIFEVSYDILLSDEMSLNEPNPAENQEKIKISKSKLSLSLIISALVAWITVVVLLIAFSPFDKKEDNKATDTDTLNLDSQAPIQHTEEHNIEIASIIEQATCEKSGKALMHCNDCDYKKITIIKAKGHTQAVGERCEECGYIKGTAGIEYATGNGYGNDYYVKSIGSCKETDIVISNMYNGKNVVAIKSEAFKNSNITSITLPDTVTTIEASAFYGCVNLKTIKLSSALKEIGEYAFYISALGPYLDLPQKLEKIGEFAFYNTKITSIHFGKDLKYIGNSAFARCTIKDVKYDGTGYWEIPNVLSEKISLNSQTFPSRTSYIWKKIIS